MTQVDSWQGATVAVDADDEIVGKTLNDTYTVERILGEGGMGRVYEARHTRIGQKKVAVKVLRQEFVRNSEILARFQREAEAAATISHPNVVAVYDVDRTSRGLPYLVCEYLEGLDLADYLKRTGKLGLPTVVHIARQLCEGLWAAHQCGVIHRDLKPHNIFLVGDFSGGVPELPFIKILDFGLSKFMDATGEELVTKTGVIMGTPAFMAPEQALGRQADHRADIYGVGAMLYTCLTGRVPFAEATPQATVLAVIGTEPARPRALEPAIPEYAELVIQRAMAKEPAERYPDMLALLNALGPLVEESRPSPHEVAPSRPGSRAFIDLEAERVKTARPELVLFLASAAALLLSSLAVAAAGVEHTVGGSLSRLELGLVLTSALALLATPTLLVLRRIRRRFWDNTGRVLGLLAALRAAVLTAVVAYGLAWLGFRVLDLVVLRLLGEPVRANVNWPGWDFLLPVIAVGAGAVAYLRESVLPDMMRGYKRVLALGLTSLATLGLVALVIPLGLRWQTRAQPSVPATAATPSTSVGPAPPSSEAVLAPSVSQKTATAPAPDTTPDPLPSGRANDEELRAANTQGAEALSPLAERYPADARVLKALVMAHASRAAGLADAMLAARRLFAVSIEEANSPDLEYLVAKAAETPGPPADLAWKMLAEDMGSYGPDVLYNLLLTRPKLAERAERLLADPAVRKQWSSALAIAYELRSATSCTSRVPLLPRAIDVGDERAIAVLASYSTGTKRGCGKTKRKPCPPACPEQAEQFREAIAKISHRLKESEKQPAQ